jgi:hypothetical protein
MKNLKKLKAARRVAGIIALIAVIGLSMFGCIINVPEEKDNGDNQFLGTWSGTGTSYGLSLVFSSNANWTMKLSGDTATGTYTYNGTTAVLTDRSNDTVTAVISGDYMTLVFGTRSYTLVRGSAPAPSLNGSWYRLLNGTTYTINGSSGVFTNIGYDAIYQNARSKGYISVGDQAFRSISKTGDRTWSGQIKLVNFNQGTTTATGTSWESCTFTMDADGDGFELYSPGANEPNMSFIRDYDY